MFRKLSAWARRADSGISQVAVSVRGGQNDRPRYRCPHIGDPLCARYGCPDGPEWKGDGCAP